jgi:hypothetical protein
MGKSSIFITIVKEAILFRLAVGNAGIHRNKRIFSYGMLDAG